MLHPEKDTLKSQEKAPAVAPSVPTIGDAWVESEPMYVDESNERTFYPDFRFAPRKRVVENTSVKTIGSPWRVEMGDVFLVEAPGSKRFPFTCNWSGKFVLSTWKVAHVFLVLRASVH